MRSNNKILRWVKLVFYGPSSPEEAERQWRREKLIKDNHDQTLSHLDSHPSRRII